MVERFGVRHGELVTHAAAVESVAARVSSEAQAGAAVRAGNAAYGKLCLFVPVALNALQDVLIDGVESAAESLRDTGSRLRRTAADYSAADTRSAGAVRSSDAGLSPPD